MKKSKLQRKFLNQMRSMGDVPWPARAYKYPPTFANAVGASRHQHIGSCKRPVGEVKVRRGRLRRKQTVEVRCGGKVFLKTGTLGQRRAYCEDCRARRRMRKQAARKQDRINRLSPREQLREERRQVSTFRRFLRRGR